MDPFGTGQINFSQFLNGIKQMSSMTPSPSMDNTQHLLDIDRKSNIVRLLSKPKKKKETFLTDELIKIF